MSTPSRRHGRSARARRSALLQATVAVAAERGVAGITHRAVTEKAGLPLATVSYFFPSIAELAGEALREFTAADAAEQVALAAALAQQQRMPDDIAAAFAAVAAPRHPQTLALFEAYLAAARSSELRPAVADALAAARRFAAAGAQAAGAPDPEAIAPAFAALAHGFALHALAVPPAVRPEDLYRALRALFVGHLLEAGHVELALALSRLPPLTVGARRAVAKSLQ
ncbi:MAG: TetR/AcrR family transcriptional regulator [Jatrophihabitantaceae bacterium]